MCCKKSAIPRKRLTRTECSKGNLSVFKAASMHETQVNRMLGQVIAWGDNGPGRAALQRDRGPGGSRCARREGVQHAHGGSPGGQSRRGRRPARHFHVVRRRRSERCGQRPVRAIGFLSNQSRPDIGRWPSPTVWWTFVCAESGEDGLMREGSGDTQPQGEGDPRCP